MMDNHTLPQRQQQVSGSNRCCSCNGKNAWCKRCKCAISGQRCTSCQPFRNSRCCNTDILPSSSQPFVLSYLQPLSSSALNTISQHLNLTVNEFPPAPCTVSNLIHSPNHYNHQNRNHYNTSTGLRKLFFQYLLG